MKKNNIFLEKKNYRGFTLVEILIYTFLLSLILSIIASFVFWLSYSNTKSKADREASENARNAMEAMLYEIKSAKSIYTPTTTQNQLSLETANYLPDDESSTFIDFFLCDLRLCLKKESQDTIFLTPDTVGISQLEFTQIVINGMPSVKINLTADYLNSSDPGRSASATLTSTASLRSY